MEEEALLGRLVSGNDRDASAAFDRLTEIVRPRLLGFLARLTSSNAEREDVAQDTLVKLWEVRGRFQYRGVDRFYAWLHLSAKRRIFDIRRVEIENNNLPDPGERDEYVDSSDLEAVEHCANTLWLGLPKDESNEVHVRMLLAAQYTYLHKQTRERVVKLLGGGICRDTLDTWVSHEGALRYLIFQQLYYPAENLLWTYVFPDKPFDEGACYDLVRASQAPSPAGEPPPGWTWPEVRILFMRYCCAILPEEIAD